MMLLDGFTGADEGITSDRTNAAKGVDESHNGGKGTRLKMCGSYLGLCPYPTELI